MFKCEQCKRQTEKKETQLKRIKYRILKDVNGKKIGKEIVSEQKICSGCYKRYGEIK